MQNNSLLSQLQAMGDVPNRDRLEMEIRELNQQEYELPDAIGSRKNNG